MSAWAICSTFGEGQANTPLVFVSIVMLTVVGAIAYLGVILVERRVLHYLPARAVGGNISIFPLPLVGRGRGGGREVAHKRRRMFVR